MATFIVNVSKIERNLDAIRAQARTRGIDFVSVVKSFHDSAQLMRLFDQRRPSYLGMSKLALAEKFQAEVVSPIMMTSIPSPADAARVVRVADVSLNSNLETIAALDRAAGEAGTRHEAIVMIDVGDLREGILPHEATGFVGAITERGFKNFSIRGIGTNYACANGVEPSARNLEMIYSLAREIGDSYAERPCVSLGGSSILNWLDSEYLRDWPTQIRIGQSILLGTMPVVGTAAPGLFTDTLVFRSTILEQALKPSAPSEPVGADALGAVNRRCDRGFRRRAILDFGVSDTDPKALSPCDPGISIVTANSDYTIVDVTNSNQPYDVGDTIDFIPKYRAMLQGFISPYLEKKYQ